MPTMTPAVRSRDELRAVVRPERGGEFGNQDRSATGQRGGHNVILSVAKDLPFVDQESISFAALRMTG